MKKAGLGSSSNWTIAAVCCLINLLTFGSFRTSGLLFPTSSFTNPNNSRTGASSPYILCTFMRCISAPLVGFLGSQFGVRYVTIFGNILGAVGMAACFFSHNINTLSVLWGILFGLGFGFGSVLLPIIINQYFDEHRAKASGISYCGAALGSLILPPIADALLNTYGISGTFLILSGFLLHCIPAAFFLKESTSASEGLKIQEVETGPKTKVTFYAGDDSHSRISDCSSNTDDEIPTSSLAIPRIEIEEMSRSSSVVSYQEKIKRLSTQTLLSNYLVRMSCSGALDMDEIIDNSKSIRNVNPRFLEAEVFSSSSQNSNIESSSASNAIDKKCRFASVQYEKPLFTRPFNENRKYSLKSSVSDSENKYFRKHLSSIDKNHYYQTSSGSIQRELSSSDSIQLTDMTNNIDEQSNNDMGELYASCSFSKHFGNIKAAPGRNKINSIMLRHRSNSSDSVNKEGYKGWHRLCCLFPSERGFKSNRKYMDFLLSPIFILAIISNIVLVLSFLYVMTAIRNLTTDIDVHSSRERHAHIMLAVAELVGYLCFGWVIDGGHMTMANFTALCLFVEGAAVLLLIWSCSFVILLVIISLLALAEAGLMMIIPVVIGDYIEENKHIVAIPCSLFLSGPFLLTISPSTGYIYDNPDALNYIAYGIGALCAVCSLLWVLVPRITMCSKR